MTEKNTDSAPERADRKAERRPDQERAKAAGRMDQDPARLGTMLSGKGRPLDDGETAKALKRASANESRR